MRFYIFKNFLIDSEIIYCTTDRNILYSSSRNLGKIKSSREELNFETRSSSRRKYRAENKEQ